MSRHLEIEFKNLLTEEEMIQLLDYFNISQADFFTQENIYLDTKAMDLRQQKKALRIRIKEDAYKLTLKEESQEGNPETNQRITQGEAKEILKGGLLPSGPVKDRLEQLKISSPLHEVTRIVTRRSTIPYHHQTLFFDISTYEGTTDYEFELETDNFNEGKQVFESILTTFKIPQRPMLHKITRALQKKQDTNHLK